MAAEPNLLTREELHLLVWDVPGIHLAKRFGLSDTGLSKICRKLDVPRPPPGWWAKKSAGHRVQITPLLKPSAGTPDHIRITPTHESTHGLREQIRAEAERIGEIVVPERLTRPHPLVAGWLADRRERQTQARRERDPWRRDLYRVPDFTMTERRRHRVLHALFRALERQGGTISQDDRSQLAATLGGETIAFELREKLRQVTRSLTPEEKRWETWNTSGVRKELEPTAFLQLTILAWTEEPVRRQWLESEKRAIDAMLPSIVATFLVLAPVFAERTRLREEAARRCAEEQRRAEEERQRRREDDNRWRQFVQIAEGWRRNDLAREFIAKLRELDLPDAEPVDGRTLAEWLEWAESKASELDPVGQGIETIFADVARIHAWTRFE